MAHIFALDFAQSAKMYVYLRLFINTVRVGDAELTEHNQRSALLGP